MANTWQIGTLYIPNYNGVAWQQPGGIGTQVFPAQQVGGAYESIQPFNEMSGAMTAGCGHSQNAPLLQQEYDEDSGELVILVLCSICSYTQYALPVAQVLSTVYNPVTVI